MSRTRPLALFAAHTPFQLFVAHELATFPDYAGHEKVLLTDIGVSGCEPDGGGWDEVVRLDAPLTGRSVLKRFKDAHLAVRALLMRRPGRSPVLLTANLEHPLSNAAFAHLRRRPGFRLHVYPEGLANLVPTRWTARRIVNLGGKWLLTRVAGAPFIAVGADLTGSRFAERIYTYAVELLPPALRSRAVALSSPPQLPQVVPGVLVLGQDLDRFMPRERAERELRSLLRFALERAEGRRLYKPHHHEAPWGRDLARSLGFEIVESPCPVELWLRSHPVSHLVSFGSSALVHVRMMYGDRIAALAYRPEVLRAVPGTSSARLSEILRVFAKVGVHLAAGPSGNTERDAPLGGERGHGSS